VLRERGTLSRPEQAPALDLSKRRWRQEPSVELLEALPYVVVAIGRCRSGQVVLGALLLGLCQESISLRSEKK
jgi:hypothetical protein